MRQLAKRQTVNVSIKTLPGNPIREKSDLIPRDKWAREQYFDKNAVGNRNVAIAGMGMWAKIGGEIMTDVKEALKYDKLLANVARGL